MYNYKYYNYKYYNYTFIIIFIIIRISYFYEISYTRIYIYLRIIQVSIKRN